MSQVSEERSKALINKLMKQGVNIERSLNFLYQAQKQQAEPAQEEVAVADSTAPM